MIPEEKQYLTQEKFYRRTEFQSLMQERDFDHHVNDLSLLNPLSGMASMASSIAPDKVDEPSRKRKKKR